MKTRIVLAVDQQAIGRVGRFLADAKGGHSLEDGAVRCSALRQIRSEGVGVDTGFADVPALLDLGHVRAGHQVLFRLLGICVAEDHVGAERQQVAHWEMEPVEAGDLDQVAEAARKLPAIGFAEQTAAVLIDRADLPASLQ
ncbi:hypothetical protein D3C71_1766960 [compost metagenome]